MLGYNPCGTYRSSLFTFNSQCCFNPLYKYSQSLIIHFPIHKWTFWLFPIYLYYYTTNFFPKWLDHFALPQAVYANSYFTIPSSKPGAVKTV